MTKTLFSSVFLILLTSIPSYSKPVKNELTKCNIYYNNHGRIYEGVTCRVWFNDFKRLSRVYFYYPQNKQWYDWSDKYTQVTPDKKYRECIRYTRPEGNQYQICTQKTPEQLGL